MCENKMIIIIIIIIIRALSIICPGLAYREALEFLHIDSILDYIAHLCKKTFSSIANDPAHRYLSIYLSIYLIVQNST